MNPNLPIALYVAGYFLLFGGWLALVLTKTPGADTLVQFIQATLGALTGHILTMINPSQPIMPAEPPVDKQAGRATLPLLMFLVIAAAVGLGMGGCASFTQAAAGYEKSAIVSVQAAEDLNIQTWAANACGTPLSAAIRNPAIVPALRALCIPAGAASSPALLLDSAAPEK